MTNHFNRLLAGLLAAVLLLTGCMDRGSQPPSEPGSQSQPTLPPAPPTAEEQRYIELLAQEVAAGIVQPGMGEYEKAKAAFDYMIESTALIDPVGLELWRVRGSYAEPPSFVENRSISVLLYGIGMCEDYAAAFTLLLRAMGMEAEYVPGLTYSASGIGFVDHAWTVAKIDGVWYHLDCQLEDNISRRDTTRYKYFMRSDATMAASHRWGQNLIDSALLTDAQNEELAQSFIAPACPQDYPTPEPRTFTSAPVPDIGELEAAITQELRDYESEHGALPPLDLNIIPPVFGTEGYTPH